MIEKARAKDAERAKMAACKSANALISKLGAVVAHLRSTVDQPEMMMVAEVIRNPLAASVSKFESLVESARATVASAGEVPLPPGADLKALSAEIAAAKKCQALAGTMLATLARAG